MFSVSVTLGQLPNDRIDRRAINFKDEIAAILRVRLNELLDGALTILMLFRKGANIIHSPTAMNFPTIDDLPVLQNVIMTVLGGRETRMISQDADARANFQAIKCDVILDINYAVFL